MKIVVLIGLVALLLFRRIKNSIGFQLYKESSLKLRMIIFAAVAAIYLSGVAFNLKILLPDVIGIIAGLVLAYIATNHAQFEKREKGLYFKTHIWVEIIVIVLFLVRFTYRIYLFRDAFQPNEDTQDAQARMQSLQDPFTGSVIIVFCVYYIGYHSFILREGKKAFQEQ